MSKSSETGVSHIEHDPRRDDPISNSRVFLIAAMVAFGGFLFGYDCIIGGPLTDTVQFQEDFGTPQEPDGKMGFTAALKGAIVCILSVGTFFGALFAPFLCDKWGRRKGIIITCVIFAVGILVQTVASHIGILMLGRAIAGFGVGLVSVMVPLYQSECVPGSRRGTMVSCYQLAITIGLLIGTIVVNFTKDMTSQASYKIPIGLQFVWSFILMVAMFFFPETPRYLIKRGDWNGAVRAKVKLTGLAPDHPLLLDELHEIKGNLDHEMNLGPGTYAQCWQGNNFRRTLLGIFMQAWQQCKPPPTPPSFLLC
jgi:MFS transporter, SP family, sugar:H+ symporter